MYQSTNTLGYNRSSSGGGDSVCGPARRRLHRILFVCVSPFIFLILFTISPFIFWILIDQSNYFLGTNKCGWQVAVEVVRYVDRPVDVFVVTASVLDRSIYLLGTN